MSWDGKQFGRPLVMLLRDDMEELCRERGYKMGAELDELLPKERRVSASLALALLMHNGKSEAAANLLSYAIVPRVGVWWCYLCYRLVAEDIEKDKAKDGLTPKERFEKEQKELVKKLTDTSDVDAMVEARKKELEAQVKELEAAAREQKYLNPVERIKLKLAVLQREYAEFEQSLPPGSMGKPDGPMAMESTVNSILEQAKSSMDVYLDTLQHDRQMVANAVKDDDPIFRAVEQKVGAVKPKIDQAMSKYFPLKMPGLPPRPTAAEKGKAVEAALRWILVPSDDNGKLACEAAMAAQDGPEAMLAYSAFWSSTNLKTETGIAPTNIGLPPLGISKTLMQLALMEGGTMDYDKRYEEFLRLGIECADGTCTWDEYGNPVRVTEEKKSTRDDSVFKSRFGFGREEHSQP